MAFRMRCCCPQSPASRLSGAPTRYAAVSRIISLADRDDDDAAAHKLADGLEALNEALQIPTLRDCVKVGHAKFEKSLEKMATDPFTWIAAEQPDRADTAEQIVELYKQAW